MSTTWTQRDLDIVEALTRHIRLLAIEQVMQIWWTGVDAHRVARRRLRRLVEAGFISRHVVNIGVPQGCSAPLVTWSPGEPEPNCQRIAHQARSRWTSAAQPREVYVATRLAANLFGSSSHGLPPLLHRDHDLLLSEAYVHHRNNPIAGAEQWLGEHAMPKAGYRIKDPDAFLLDSAGQVMCVIESAGRYDSKQVESFHDYCFSSNYSYELW